MGASWENAAQFGGVRIVDERVTMRMPRWEPQLLRPDVVGRLVVALANRASAAALGGSIGWLVTPALRALRLDRALRHAEQPPARLPRVPVQVGRIRSLPRACASTSRSSAHWPASVLDRCRRLSITARGGTLGRRSGSGLQLGRERGTFDFNLPGDRMGDRPVWAFNCRVRPPLFGYSRGL